MPPKKRKSAARDAEENDTDDEKQQAKKKQQKTFPIFNSSRLETAAKKSEAEKIRFDLEWSEHGEVTSKMLRPLIYLHSETVEGRAKIAAFDIDNTVIVTKSGKKFATNAQDWKWFDASRVPDKLKQLDKDNYRIVFITNQAGVEKGHTKVGDLKHKFEAMIKELDIPVFVFISTGETHFRKPSTQMWDYFVKNCNQGVSIDMQESFYVGDAAGRPKNWAVGKPKDFSCADRMFASNIKLKFFTPEELFLNQKPVAFDWGSVDPIQILKKHATPSTTTTTTAHKKYHISEQEMVIMQGPPASGKSTFTKNHFLINPNYVHINRDTLQTQEKCLKAAESALKEGKSVVVDNTNPDKKARLDFVALAKRMSVKKLRLFKMTTPIELCHHLNYVRQNATLGKVRRIPDVGYNMFKSRFEEPDKSEGYDEIVQVEFEPKFEDERHETIFKQWTG